MKRASNLHLGSAETGDMTTDSTSRHPHKTIKRGLQCSTTLQDDWISCKNAKLQVQLRRIQKEQKELVNEKHIQVSCILRILHVSSSASHPFLIPTHPYPCRGSESKNASLGLQRTTETQCDLDGHNRAHATCTGTGQSVSRHSILDCCSVPYTSQSGMPRGPSECWREPPSVMTETSLVPATHSHLARPENEAEKGLFNLKQCSV